jgi:integrase
MQPNPSRVVGLVQPSASGRFLMLSKTMYTLRRPGEPLDLTGRPARLVTDPDGNEMLVEELPVDEELPVEPRPEPMKPVERIERHADSVNDWGTRLNKSETYIKRRMSKLRQLFDWLAIQRKQPGFDDMNAVTAAELIRYEDEVLLPNVRTGDWKHATVRDHLIDIKAQFNYARGRLKIDSNPAANLKTYDPDDGQNGQSSEYEDFTKAEVSAILTAAAASDDPVVKFGNWLAAVHGSRVGELVEARTSHISLDEETGLWVFDYTLTDRPKGRRIKTGFSARKLPIPQMVIIDLGLLEYIEQVRRDYHAGDHGDLFPMLRAYGGRLNTDGSRVLMAFLRDVVGIKGKRRVFHSWRSTVATALEGKVPETTARHITGHAPRTKGERYIRHHPGQLSEAIALIPLPNLSMAGADGQRNAAALETRR